MAALRVLGGRWAGVGGRWAGVAGVSSKVNMMVRSSSSSPIVYDCSPISGQWGGCPEWRFGVSSIVK